MAKISLFFPRFLKKRFFLNRKALLKNNTRCSTIEHLLFLLRKGKMLEVKRDSETYNNPIISGFYIRYLRAGSLIGLLDFHRFYLQQCKFKEKVFNAIVITDTEINILVLQGFQIMRYK